jgi:hypothetical protein
VSSVLADAWPQAVAGGGVFAILVYIARVALATDRPLRTAVDDAKKREDASEGRVTDARARNTVLEQERTVLHVQLLEANTRASVAAAHEKGLQAELDYANRRVGAMELENEQLRAKLRGQSDE